MKSLSTAFIILITVIVGSYGHAQPLHDRTQLAAQNQYQSLDQAVQQIKQQTGGRILSAKTVGRTGNKKHVIKVLLPSGKVRIFKVNAR
jgi:uncharacterized membrane protein YkoI